MALTEEQILKRRAELGIPPEGFNKSGTPGGVKPFNSEEFIAELRNAAKPSNIGPFLPPEVAVKRGIGVGAIRPEKQQQEEFQQLQQQEGPFLPQEEALKRDLSPEAVRPQERAEFIEKRDAPKPGIFERTATEFKSGIEIAKESSVGVQEAFKKGEIGKARFALEATGAILQSVVLPFSRAIGGALEPATTALVDIASKTASGITPDFIEEPVKEAFVNAVQKAQEEFETLDPQTQRSLGNLTKTFESLLAIATAGVAGAGAKAVGKPVVKKVLEKGAELVAKTPEVVKPILSNLRETAKKAIEPLSEIAKKRRLNKIEELIRPNLTKKSKALAIREKRVTQGKKRFFRTTKKDIVASDKKTKVSAKSIEGLITGAHKMDQFTLSNLLDDTASKIAQELSSEMKNVAVNKSSLTKASKKWDDIKKKQAKDPEFKSLKTSGTGAQDLFQEFLDETTNAKTLDDLWNIRKRYDNLIKETVKQADITSDISRQLQKEIWLENREILNTLLKEASDGLGDRVKKDFSDMSNLYSARQNIIQRADILTKDKPGVLKKVIKTGVAGGAAGLGFGVFSD